MSATERVSLTSPSPAVARRRTGRVRARAQRAFESWATEPQGLVALSKLRLVLGIAGLQFYVSDIGNAAYLWGPHGVISPEVARADEGVGQFSVYLFFPHSTAYFWAVLAAGVAACLYFTVRGGTWATLLHGVLLVSLYNRNPDILEGGDNLAWLLLLLLVFTVNDAHLRLGSPRRRKALPPWRVIVHNTAVKLLLFQVVVVYVTAGLYKASSGLWRSGTAMYYISGTHQFSFLPVFADQMAHRPLDFAVCWVTIVIEAGSVYLLFVRRRLQRLRIVHVAMLMLMHIGIALTMDLVAFATIMLAADCILLDDRDYARVREWAVGARGVRRRAGLRRGESHP